MDFLRSYARRLPTYLAIALLVVLAGRFLPGIVDRFGAMSIITLACVNIILAVSLNIVLGQAGQFSLGHAAFMGIGAYTASMLTLAFASDSTGGGWTTPFFISALVAGGVVAAGFGFLVGLPTLRLRGDYLAIATLGFGEIMRIVLLNIESVGGATGLKGIPNLSSFTLTLAVVVITLIVAKNLKFSAHGRALLAVRDDEIAAESVGISTTRYKVIAFVIGAFFAGVAGGLYAHHYRAINPSLLGWIYSVQIVLMVILGGSGSVTGAAIGGIVLAILPELLRESFRVVHLQRLNITEYLIYSVLLVLMMLVRREGIIGSREVTVHSFRRILPPYGTRDHGAA